MEASNPKFCGGYLLQNPLFNKDTAFTVEEREEYGLQGLLPEKVETLGEQVERHYHQYQQFETKLQKCVYLNELYFRNQVLFYKLISEHLEEMLPVIYTPTVGDMVVNYSKELRRPYGLYISYPSKDKIAAALDQVDHDIDLLVVTDGSAVLGIGDQGFGGMAISVGKLMVYTGVGGIDPRKVIPIVLDVGTDNRAFLEDPMYLGWRHERVTGQEYDDFIDQFVQEVEKRFPGVLLHWEDFSKHTSLAILNRYRPDILTFNDDIQGTGGVTVACVLTALRKISSKLSEQRIVFLGAGSSAVGIAEQLVSAVEAEGLTHEEAMSRVWLLNSKGLVTAQSSRLSEFQLPFARKTSEQDDWELQDSGKIDLLDVVRNVKPTVLIGCSTVSGSFTEEIVKEMVLHVEYPVILPLSNPSSKAEALPKDLINWTDGKALIATGSPFEPVNYKGKTFKISQCNNAFVFPALGLGTLAVKATRITDGMIHAASNYLSKHQQKKGETASLLPDLAEYPGLSKKIALAVAEQAIKEGVAGVADDADLEKLIEESFWEPQY